MQRRYIFSARRIFGLILVMALVSSNACTVYVPPPSYPILTYSSYIGGEGTSPYFGAIEIIINPDGYYSPYQYYDVSVPGFFSERIQPGPYQRVLYTFLPPGSYSFGISVGCYGPGGYYNGTYYNCYYD